MNSGAATPVNDRDRLTLGAFQTYVLDSLRAFSHEWLKHQSDAPEVFPSAINLEEWWTDFSEFMESDVREAMVATEHRPAASALLPILQDLEVGRASLALKPVDH